MAKKKLKARGNYRRPTPGAALKYIKAMAKKGITTANDIKDDVKDAAVKKIRLREALYVKNEFDKKMEAYETAKKDYDAKMAEFKALGKNKVFEQGGLPAKFVRPKAPVKPSLTGPRSVRGGNFRRTTKKQAKAYLARLFNRGSSPKDKRPLSAYSPTSHAKRSGANMNQFTPRINEAAQILGPADVATAWARGEQNRIKREQAAVAKAAKAEEAKKTRDSKKVAALEKKRQALAKEYEKAGLVLAGASRARRARRSRRLRRRAR